MKQTLPTPNCSPLLLLLLILLLSFDPQFLLANSAIAGTRQVGRYLVGYWHNFVNDACKPLKLSNVPAEYDIIIAAFASSDAANRGGVTFSVDPGVSQAIIGGYTDTDFKAEIAALKQQGVRVLMSVGGETASTNNIDSIIAANNFANTVAKLCQDFGFSGVDIDLEHGLSATFLGQALNQISKTMSEGGGGGENSSDSRGDNFMITLAPQTLDIATTTSEYIKLIDLCKNVITLVNVQFYNSGR